MNNPSKKYRNIIAEFKQGVSIAVLSEKYKTAEHVIWNTLKYRYKDLLEGIIPEKKKRSLSEKNRNIIRDYIAGESIHGMSRRYGISRARIYQIIDGVGKRRAWKKPISVFDKPNIISHLRVLLEEGKPINQAAFEAGISPSTAYKMVKAYSLKETKTYKKRGNND